MRRLVKFLIVTYFILLSPLVTSCAEGDGLIKAPPPNTDWLGWQSLVNPALQKSYEERTSLAKEVEQTTPRKKIPYFRTSHNFNES